jgi:hypothetical protein
MQNQYSCVRLHFVTYVVTGSEHNGDVLPKNYECHAIFLTSFCYTIDYENRDNKKKEYFK